MRRIVLAAMLATLALPARASANPWLSKAQAERDTRAIALRSAHRVWRLTDTTVESMHCKRFNAQIVMCYATVGLHYSVDECVPPVEASALFIIGQTSSGFVWRQNAPWEVDPAGGAPLCEPEPGEEG
jgi:hypothetical protein